MKPVATGGRRQRVDGTLRWVSEDALRLSRAAGVDDSLALINPVCFREPLAPWTAARRARQPIRRADLHRAFDTLRDRHEALIVEGVGGVRVPLAGRWSVAELAQSLRLPVLLIARTHLGTLNHTLLSLECLQRLRLPVAGVILNEAPPPPTGRMARLAARTNPDLLRRLVRCPVLGPLPYRRGLAAASPAALRRWLARSLDDRAVDTLRRLC
jgi:dethiobiotin synthetase